MASGADEPTDLQHPEPPRPSNTSAKENGLGPLGKSDSVKLQKFAQRAAMFRRLTWLFAILVVLFVFALLFLFARQSGAVRY